MIRTALDRGSLLLASGNPAKIALYGQAFAHYGWKTSSLSELGLATEVEESGQTAEENAIIKVKAAWEPGRTVFADDSGLEVDALGGEPGVQIRRWNGLFRNDVSDQEWLDFFLARLQGVPLAERTARFVTAWALIDRDGRVDVKRTVTPFMIAEQPIRPMLVGWPLSAVQIRLPEAEPDADRFVHRELGTWEFFRSL